MVELAPIAFSALVGVAAYLLGLHWILSFALFIALGIAAGLWFEDWFVKRAAKRYCLTHGWTFVEVSPRKNHYVLKVDAEGVPRTLKVRRAKGGLTIVDELEARRQRSSDQSPAA